MRAIAGEKRTNSSDSERRARAGEEFRSYSARKLDVAEGSNSFFQENEKKSIEITRRMILLDNSNKVIERKSKT